MCVCVCVCVCVCAVTFIICRFKQISSRVMVLVFLIDRFGLLDVNYYALVVVF